MKIRLDSQGAPNWTACVTLVMLLAACRMSICMRQGACGRGEEGRWGRGDVWEGHGKHKTKKL